MSGWRREIEELHEFFEAYFLGAEHSLDRVEASLAPEFTIIGPHGTESSRADTMQALLAGHGHTSSLRITTTDHRLLHESPGLVVASYVEHHELADRSNHRVTTAVFVTEPSAPNGVRWLRAHETWVTPSD